MRRFPIALATLLLARVSPAQSSSPPPPTEVASPAPASASPAPASTAPASPPPSASPSSAPDESGTPITPSEGRLRIAVNRPDTDVFIDGARAGVAPFERDLLPGSHTIRLVCVGYHTWSGTVEIEPEMLTPVRVLLRPAMSRSGGVTTLVVASLFLGAGITFGALSASDASALSNERNLGRLDNHDPRIDRGEVFGIVADAGFAMTVVLAAVGIYMVAHDTSSPSIARVGRARRVGP